MASSALSRRASEFLGVALFAIALLWVVSLVTWEPSDPVWFFSSGATHPPANFAGLVGAIAWDVITWYLGLPTSSSHALVGGMAGAAVAKAGWAALIASGLQKIIVFIVLSPLVGLLLGFTIMVSVYWLFHRDERVDRLHRRFRRMQLVSAAAFSLMHGANDAQKTMGIISGALVTGGYLQLQNGKMPIPVWVILIAHTAIGLGTLSGGWRIIKTMGSKITKLQPFGGFAAETAGAITLFGASSFGIPVSTTHTITGAIIGVGAVKRLSAVRWGVARQIVWAWILTIPASALAAGVAYVVISPFL